MVTITATNASGNTATVTVTVKEIVGIEVTSPTKTMYYAGETLDTEGMAVMAIYSDGTSVEVTDYDIDPTLLMKDGTNSVTVSYNGFEDSFYVTVGTVNGIQIQLPSVIYAGTTFDVDNLNIMISYTNGLPSRSPVGDVNFDPVTATVGDTTLKISYSEAGFTTENTFTITVVEQPAETE